MRSQLPTLELDAVFEAKEDLALAVKNALATVMSGYGYSIIQALITDLDPDEKVKAAMNEINSSKRLKFAVAERAEGEKILEVKRAEVRVPLSFIECFTYFQIVAGLTVLLLFVQAEANAKYLSGVGVAKQRKAIVDGLKSSIVNFHGSVEGSSTKDVMDLLLLTQVCTLVWFTHSSHMLLRLKPSTLRDIPTVL
jgi:SPFH domain / Band 7 family